MSNLRKTFVFGLLAAVCALMPFGSSLSAATTNNQSAPTITTEQAAWHGGWRHGGWGRGWGGWGGRGFYFYSSPYYYSYGYPNYYYYPYYYNYYPYGY